MGSIWDFQPIERHAHILHVVQYTIESERRVKYWHSSLL